MQKNQNGPHEESPQEEPSLSDVLTEYCDELLERRHTIIDLFDALNRQSAHITRPASNEEIEMETRIARTVMKLLSGEAAMLSSEAANFSSLIEERLE
jgi:hypothetical protein